LLLAGDRPAHKQLKQVVPYVNRYGPGMVIYWFGYVDSINAPSNSSTDHHSDIYIAAAFPQACDIMQPDDAELLQDDETSGSVTVVSATTVHTATAVEQ
jgi:Protein of unknown function TPD sequence-motif